MGERSGCRLDCRGNVVEIQAGVSKEFWRGGVDGTFWCTLIPMQISKVKWILN